MSDININAVAKELIDALSKDATKSLDMAEGIQLFVEELKKRIEKANLDDLVAKDKAAKEVQKAPNE